VFHCKCPRRADESVEARRDHRISFLHGALAGESAASQRWDVERTALLQRHEEMEAAYKKVVEVSNVSLDSGGSFLMA
jgi:hypothetical protein